VGQNSGEDLFPNHARVVRVFSRPSAMAHVHLTLELEAIAVPGDAGRI
jgi:hypothetical protein